MSISISIPIPFSIEAYSYAANLLALERMSTQVPLGMYVTMHIWGPPLAYQEWKEAPIFHSIPALWYSQRISHWMHPLQSVTKNNMQLAIQYPKISSKYLAEEIVA